MRLWEEALALNERDKLESNNKLNNFSFDGGGSVLERSTTTSSSDVHTWSFEINIQEEIVSNIGGKVNSAGVEIENKWTISQDVMYGGSTDSTNSNTVGFTLTDPDIWDRYSIDVFESERGFGPIFKISAGESSCPHEGQLVTKYHEPGTTIAAGTIQLEQPTLLIDGQKHSEQINIPDDETAEFVFTLGNESTQGWAYSLGLLNHTNTGGAIIVNSGTSELGTAPFTIGAGQQTQQRIIIERGGADRHDSLLFVFHSTCQYDQGNDFDADIADTAYVRVEFVPSCTDITIHQPTDNWVLNNSFNNRMNIVMSDYNYNQDRFESFQLQYRPSSQATWIPLHTYHKDATGIPGANVSEISQSASSTTFIWDVTSFNDTEYDLRAVTDCGVATNESEIVSGFIDRSAISVFGTPSPADGILDPNDDILLTMNETIETGGLSELNFDVRGVLNGAELRHETSLSFDGQNDFATIPEYQLQERSLMVEFWLRRNTFGEQVILSQGSSATDQLAIFFTGGNQLSFQLGDEVLTSSTSITDQNWHHYAIVYDRENSDGQIIMDFDLDITNNSFAPNYGSDGELLLGTHSAGGLSNFNGFIHELRLWSIPRTVPQIASAALVTLSGRETGLIGNWPLTEGFGDIGLDKVRSRHAQISGASWNILPQNHGFAFNGSSDYLEALGAGTLGFSETTDMTIEAWFKTDASVDQTIISNGRADGTRPEDFAWDVYLNSSGAVVLENDGNSLSSGGSYNDNNWHHFSAVIERTRAVSIYIDGELVNTGNSSDFKGFAGPKLWIGARGVIIGSTEVIDQYFDGTLDDIRIWNTARRPEQVQRDFVHQLSGDEIGLQAYYPFDGIEDMLGIFLRNPDLVDASENDFDLSLGGTTQETFTEDAPPVKLPRLIEQVNFSYSINNDQVFIAVTDPPARVENVTLDITVRGLRDQAGNFMESPETWIAFINKNQVFWEEEYFSFEKVIDESLAFTATIKNTGGRQESFTLSNLPSWLTASPSSGLIDPNSSVEVTFDVQPLLNIGEYEQDIFVTTQSFGFNERLLLDLKVIVDPPDWTVDAEAFSQSMNIVGELRINDVISTDEEDIVSIWLDDELRGVANVEFDPSSGKHLVFLTVLSDVTSGETLEFRAWDASRGRVLTGLTPDDIVFESGTILNSRGNPMPIQATVLTELTYTLNPGWNWISFPLDAAVLTDLDATLSELEASLNDEVKYLGQASLYSGGSWRGSLQGFDTDKGYRIRTSEGGSFRYEGTFVDPSNDPIDIVPGWNWIGVKSEFIIDVSSAMSSLDPQTGDVIKGQRSFAIYEEGFGWGGNLDFLQPQVGYMLNYHSSDQLFYPRSINTGQLRSSERKSRSNKDASLAVAERLNYEIGGYATNMSLTAEIDACGRLEEGGQDLDLSQWSLAAFVEGECRGVVSSDFVQSLDKYLFYLTVEGDVSADVDFRLIHNAEDTEILLEDKITYASNSVVGSSLQPYKFSCVPINDCVEMSSFRTSDVDQSSSVQEIQVRLDLISNARLSSDKIFRFKAGRSIQLLGEFEVPRRAVLEAYIEDCPN